MDYDAHLLEFTEWHGAQLLSIQLLVSIVIKVVVATTVIEGLLRTADYCLACNTT